MLLGLDISIWQDDNSTPQRVNFRQSLAGGAKFVFIKASQGTWTDQDFIWNWQSAKVAGIPAGAYHYLDWRYNHLEQARFFAGLLKHESGSLSPVLDYEMRSNAPSRSTAVRMGKEFVQEVEYQLGCCVMVYTSPGFWAERGGSESFWRERPLWVAHYGVKTPQVPKPWETWLFWQFTAKGPGAAYGAESESIDLNYFNGDAARFAGLFGAAAPPTPETPTLPVSQADGASRIIFQVIDEVYIREGPSTRANIVGQLQPGESVPALEIVGDDAWLKHERGYSAINYRGKQYMRFEPQK
jgi:GH25 family lysozyme M1 (1,4-beta-N-acetylmuramidase)